LRDSIRNELRRFLAQNGLGERKQGNMLPILGGFAKGGGEAASMLFQQQFTEKMAQLGFTQNMALQDASFASKGVLQEEYLKMQQKNALELKQLEINTENRLARSGQLQNNAIYHDLPKDRNDYAPLLSHQEHQDALDAEEAHEHALNTARIQQHIDNLPNISSTLNYGSTAPVSKIGVIHAPDYDATEDYQETRPIGIPRSNKHEPHSAIFNLNDVQQKTAGAPPTSTNNSVMNKRARIRGLDDAWQSATVAQKKKERMDRLDGAWRNSGSNGPTQTLSQFTGGISKA